MDNQLSSVTEHYQFLAYAKQEATAAHNSIYRLFKNEHLRAHLKDATLKKMRDFFNEFIFLTYEIDLLEAHPSLSDETALGNLLSEVDYLVDRAKDIMLDVKYLIAKD
jgi:hypothetical protein